MNTLRIVSTGCLLLLSACSAALDARTERVKEIAAAVQSRTTGVEIVYVPGEQHATRILESRPDIAERIAVWLASNL